MYCEQCGAENSENAKFCRKCGRDLGGEEETRVVKRASDPKAVDEKLFSITPTMKFVWGAYLLTAVAAVLLVALIVILFPSAVPVSIAVILGLLLFVIPLFYHVRQRLVRYTLTDDKLEIDSGLISRTTRSVPLRRIQDVTVSATMGQRLLGLGDIVIDNASEEGGKAVIRDVDGPRHYADMLLEEMRKAEK